MKSIKTISASILSLSLLAGCTAAPAADTVAEDAVTKDIPEETAIPVSVEATPTPEIKAPDGADYEDAYTEHEVATIAVFGIDDYTDRIAGDQADAIKILAYDYNTQSAEIISVARDLIVHIGGSHNTYGWINEGVTYGDDMVQLEALNKALDMNIEKYISFDYKALKELVDGVGGVDVELSQAEIDQTSRPLGITGKAGTYTLNGDQAIKYVRIYKIDSDDARIDRSTNLIKGVAKKMQGMNPLAKTALITKILPYLHTNLSLEEIVKYIGDVSEIKDAEISKYTIPEAGSYRKIESMDNGKLADDYVKLAAEVHEMIYGISSYETSQDIKDYNTKIQGDFN